MTSEPLELADISLVKSLELRNFALSRALTGSAVALLSVGKSIHAQHHSGLFDECSMGSCELIRKHVAVIGKKVDGP